MTTPGSGTFQILLDLNKKTLSTSGGLSNNLRLKFLCDVLLPLLPDLCGCTFFTKQTLNQMSTADRCLPLTDKLFKSCKFETENLYLHPNTFCKKEIFPSLLGRSDVFILPMPNFQLGRY